jgi:two-component system cell cycle sensor histidine kinase PleC
MRQVALNLLSNAIKFTPRGGAVTVRIAPDGDGAAVLTIADTGIGIPADRLRHIGQPFVRAEDQHNRNSDGTGLGLALTNALVALHGGTLAIASEVGRGTTVTVRLPAERSVVPARAPSFV